MTKFAAHKLNHQPPAAAKNDGIREGLTTKYTKAKHCEARRSEPTFAPLETRIVQLMRASRLKFFVPRGTKICDRETRIIGRELGERGCVGCYALTVRQAALQSEVRPAETTSRVWERLLTPHS